METKETLVVMDTTLGKIKFKLYNDTPQHRDNFIKLAKAGQYDGLLFHRVIKDFMEILGIVELCRNGIAQVAGS